MDTAHKIEKLKNLLKGLDGAVVAFSGGVDSSFLLAKAVDALGDKVLAVTAVSSTYPESERRMAGEVAAQLGARHLEVVSEELDIPGFSENRPDRCYHCKTELFGILRKIAEAEGLAHVLDGNNADDIGDYRPGRIAAKKMGVLSPLEEVGLTKEEIRAESKIIGLPTWARPAMACLASRFPYGSAITRAALDRVGKAEEALRGLGLTTLRLRCHGDLARLELDAENIARAAGELREDIVRIIKEAGFAYVSLDLQGYRTGAMNEVLTESEKVQG